MFWHALERADAMDMPSRTLSGEIISGSLTICINPLLLQQKIIASTLFSTVKIKMTSWVQAIRISRLDIGLASMKAKMH